MKEYLQKTYEHYLLERIQHENVLAIVSAKQNDQDKILSIDPDLISLVVVHNSDRNWAVKQLDLHNLCVEEHIVTDWQLHQWLLQGVPEKILSIYRQGEIVHDSNNLMHEKGDKFLAIPKEVKKRYMCEHYLAFIQSYVDSKEALQLNMMLDAFHTALQALIYWGQLEIIEAGEWPEEPVLHKVKSRAPSIYKLYEEVITSYEPLEKKIELLLLPIEMQLMAKVKAGTEYLIDKLKQELRPWKTDQIISLLPGDQNGKNIVLLLDRMVKRGVLHEVFLPVSGGVFREKAYLVHPD
ncbi:nucleotidyltransferase-like protein [Brevibacillus daliensis]|uniref:nucleotidyltransferase-like protein n=1 Tax=Brevibacillus daliensis TaxID=2892995 RepID=UPI001E2C5F5F|nr:nucleotidyltransferase-like protein [Brevibacillus daliensis]